VRFAHALPVELVIDDDALPVARPDLLNSGCIRVKQKSFRVEEVTGTLRTPRLENVASALNEVARLARPDHVFTALEVNPVSDSIEAVLVVHNEVNSGGVSAKNSDLTSSTRE
jgi:hypothetical protein